MSALLINRRNLLAGAALMAVPLGLAACSQTAPIDEQGRIRLRVAAPGPARAEHGGFYQAIASGLYADRGLNVQIFHGNSTLDVSRHLAAGSAELGLLDDNFAVVQLLSQRAPVKAVAAFFQKSPRALIAHDRNSPRDFTDLSDRPIYTNDAEWTDIWQWLYSRYQLPEDQLQRLQDGTLTPFIEDNRALLLGNLTRDPAAIEAADPQSGTRLLLPSDNGYPSYGSLLMSPNSFARDNAQALRDFITATIEGWMQYLDGNPEPAHALIRRANPATPQGSLDTARTLLKRHDIVTGSAESSVTIGTMQTERWSDFAAQSKDSYAYELDWESAFTTQFLPKSSKMLGRD